MIMTDLFLGLNDINIAAHVMETLAHERCL